VPNQVAEAPQMRGVTNYGRVDPYPACDAPTSATPSTAKSHYDDRYNDNLLVVSPLP